MNGNRIKEVKARQVLDSKGRPVVETEIYTENGKMGRAGGVIDLSLIHILTLPTTERV